LETIGIKAAEHSFTKRRRRIGVKDRYIVIVNDKQKKEEKERLRGGGGESSASSLPRNG